MPEDRSRETAGDVEHELVRLLRSVVCYPRPTMRLASLTFAALVVFAGTVAGARADGLDLGSPEAKRIRATLAWRRAVWRVDREDFDRARKQLEGAMDAGANPDWLLQYTLGLSYLRLNRVAEADIYLAKARRLVPSFVGLTFTDAFRLTVVKAKDDADAQEKIRAALDRYREFFEKLGAAPPDTPFKAELSFAGHVYRGLLESRVQDEWDHAVKDLEAAMKLSEDNGWTPAAEVVSLLADVHKSLDQLDAAKNVVKAAMARDPAEASHHYNYGALLVAGREYAAARPWFEAALARRSDLIDAHMKLAFIGMQLHEPASMLPHLEAAKAIQEMRANGGAAPDAQADANADSGFGVYFKLIGDERFNADDEKGALFSYETAARYFREALSKEPGCVQAVNMLIQLSSRIRMPPAELEELKKKLQELTDPKGGGVQPYKSTFC